MSSRLFTNATNGMQIKGNMRVALEGIRERKVNIDARKRALVVPNCPQNSRASFGAVAGGGSVEDGQGEQARPIGSRGEF